MNNFEKAWKQISQEMNTRDISPKTNYGRSTDSAMLISQIRKKLKLGMGWTLFFLLALFAVAVMHLGEPQILMVVGAGILLMWSSLLASRRYYLKIKNQPHVARDTKSMLIDYYNWVVKLLRMERIWTQFAIPCYLILGLLYGQLRTHGSFDQIVFDGRMLVITALLMVVVVPLVIVWVSWSQKYAYRKDLEDLEAAIEDLGNNHES